MNLPIEGTWALVLAVVFGMVFGVLLHRGGVANYNVIVNQFRLIDFTVLKIMFTALVVGGIGVFLLNQAEWAEWHIKSAQLLGVALGAAIFGVGMVVYGYCPGTGVAAVGTGSIHALVGFIGMLIGGALYAFSFEWVQVHVLPVADMGKARLPEMTGIPDWIWLIALIAIALAVFYVVERIEHPPTRSKPPNSTPPVVAPSSDTA